ncbi:Single-stranded-DNA-specific exonuclease RecJ [Dirofilaria immitis]|nr:Single-stranded-DNA-specific exonuclease RecJ [Dirofilaria immitis]
MDEVEAINDDKNIAIFGDYDIDGRTLSALINRSKDDRDLAAIGVSFLLIVAVNKSLREQGFFTNRKEPNLFDLLDLVALGTVCDAMQIIGLNGAFVSQRFKNYVNKQMKT